jgi:hypothetical protein
MHPELLKKDVLSRPQFWLENPTWICCGAFQLNQFRACKNNIILLRARSDGEAILIALEVLRNEETQRGGAIRVYLATIRVTSRYNSVLVVP